MENDQYELKQPNSTFYLTFEMQRREHKEHADVWLYAPSVPALSDRFGIPRRRQTRSCHRNRSGHNIFKVG